ncbi:hypothetical protein OPV22_035197 [Ensete ventricosum]|uniref:Uncharacterized protein n=1 Tax=Ensete ventricosum TaxID=4639 RepID=A0AAX5K368_ENSVE|nr:hypothetical protein OPV22_035197 [Ensete ventricosum]
MPLLFVPSKAQQLDYWGAPVKDLKATGSSTKSSVFFSFELKRILRPTVVDSTSLACSFASTPSVFVGDEGGARARKMELHQAKGKTIENLLLALSGEGQVSVSEFSALKGLPISPKLPPVCLRAPRNTHQETGVRKHCIDEK